MVEKANIQLASSNINTQHSYEWKSCLVKILITTLITIKQNLQHLYLQTILGRKQNGLAIECSTSKRKAVSIRGGFLVLDEKNENFSILVLFELFFKWNKKLQLIVTFSTEYIESTNSSKKSFREYMVTSSPILFAVILLANRATAGMRFLHWISFFKNYLLYYISHNKKELRVVAPLRVYN